MIKLSRRLEAVARLVTPGNVVCDVGTDHGYIPIWLIQTGVCKRALAMDVNEGPLMRAREHIAECGLTDYIVTRRSDGLKAMEEKECGSIVIAGMGGGLVIRILSDSFAKLEAVEELILQPQSDIEQVRRFVAERGFAIVQQDMVKEDGKYYMMFKCVHDTRRNQEGLEIQTAYDRYGQQLIWENHPVLREYLEKEEKVFGQIRESLVKQKDSVKASIRMQELEEKQRTLELARKMMEKSTDEV